MKLFPIGLTAIPRRRGLRCWALWLVFLATGAGGLFGSSTSADVVDLGPKLQPFIAREQIPGMAALVLRGDRIVAEGVAGIRKKGSPEAVKMGDEFEIASCAKAMTATLAAMLVEQGKLRWDTSLADIFGDSASKVDPAWTRVTVLQLLHHRSGITKDHYVRFLASTLFAGGSPTVERRRYAEKELSHPPDIAPGTRFVYANTNYILIAAALEKITGQKWEDLIRERLFQPLGMTTAGIGPPGTPGQIDQPWGHGGRRLLSLIPMSQGDEIPFDPGSGSADFPLAGAPAGLVHMSVADWAKFVVLQLRGDPVNPHCEPALLSPESFAALHSPDPAAGNSGGFDCYAAGWSVGARPWAKGGRPGDKGLVLWHPGDNGRWNCVVWIAPEIDFAVLVACNRASMWVQCDEVAAALVHEFVSETKRVSIPGMGLQGRWEAFFWGQADGMQRLRLALEINDANTDLPKGTLVSVDEGNSRFPVTGISRTNGVFRIEFKAIHAVFQGELSPDGSEISGHWEQKGSNRPLVFRRLPQPAAAAGLAVPRPP